MSLANEPPLEAAAHIVEGAAAAYVVGKTISGDPYHVRSRGGLIPTVIVHNDAEYAAVTVGMFGIASIMGPVIAVVLFLEWVFSGLLMVMLPLVFMIPDKGSSLPQLVHLPPPLALVIGIALAVCWLIQCVKVTRWAWRKVFGRGPDTEFAPDYRGRMRPNPGHAPYRSQAFPQIPQHSSDRTPVHHHQLPLPLDQGR